MMSISPLYDILHKLHNDVDFESHEALIDEGVLDSFDIVSLVAEISEAYGLQVPPEEITPENFNSARLIFAMLERVSEE
ncbi:MAG: phosphopantetheine-binding protein [Clostridiales bacterium]|jgi:acyl carrier protein|nr:phosphopantetheine-binding protein [Clostridiales bacterium]